MLQHDRVGETDLGLIEVNEPKPRQLMSLEAFKDRGLPLTHAPGGLFTSLDLDLLPRTGAVDSQTVLSRRRVVSSGPPRHEQKAVCSLSNPFLRHAHHALYAVSWAVRSRIKFCGGVNVSGR